MKKHLPIIIILSFVLIVFLALSRSEHSYVDSVFDDLGINWPNDIVRANEEYPPDAVRGDFIEFKCRCSIQDLEKVAHIFKTNVKSLINKKEVESVFRSEINPNYPWSFTLQVSKDKEYPDFMFVLNVRGKQPYH